MYHQCLYSIDFFLDLINLEISDRYINITYQLPINKIIFPVPSYLLPFCCSGLPRYGIAKSHRGYVLGYWPGVLALQGNCLETGS